jgi:hypothetical protein
MLYAGLDLSRKRLDVHVLDEEGRTVEVTAVPAPVASIGSPTGHGGRHERAHPRSLV